MPPLMTSRYFLAVHSHPSEEAAPGVVLIFSSPLRRHKCKSTRLMIQISPHNNRRRASDVYFTFPYTIKSRVEPLQQPLTRVQRQ